MIPRGCQPRAGTPISLIAIHTAEGALTTASLAAYLDGADVEASYHILVDDVGAVRYIDDSMAAWAMLSGNPRALQLCFTGFAAWSREEWLGHRRMLALGAAQVASWSRLHQIPTRKLTPTQVGADWYGICGHWDWTLGKRDGTHTDPGANFPWDVFIALVNGATTATEDDPVPWRLEATAHAVGQTKPDASWPAVEDTITLPGPQGGWRGRELAHVTFGNSGGWVQEAWWAPSGQHVVDPAKPIYCSQFAIQSWEAPAGARALVLRYAAPAGGSVGIETQT